MKHLPWLNYHHLQYFRAIVREGGVTKAAQKLNLSQSTLSAQLKDLEESLGSKLFEREGRSLVLTEAGQVALDYAEDIFQTGDELRAWFAEVHPEGRRSVRIGALSPLSKNLQFEIIRPLVMAGETHVQVVEGEMQDMMERLKHHQIDLLLSNVPPGGADAEHTHAHVLGEMPVYLVGRPPFKIPKKPFPKWLDDIPLFLPSGRSAARVEFDAMLVRAGVAPKVQAEVDDMALLRLLALTGAGLALVPEIGVKFELEEKRLLRIEKIKNLKERFYAITARRSRLPQQIVDIIESGKEVLAAAIEQSRKNRARTRGK
ncbi:MAG: LysR family transcriptional regulator [Verrucomicrobiota bacterium]